MSAPHLCARLFMVPVSVAIIAVAVPARADAVLALDWQAPSDCPTGQSVTRAVEKLVTRPPAKPLEATSTVHRRGERFIAEIRTPRGARRLEGESCRAVAEAVAMVLALAIDPEASPNAQAFAAFDEPDEPARSEAKPEVVAKEPVPVPTSEVVPKPNDRASEKPKKSAESGTDPRFFAALFGLAELGMLPGATLGASLGLGLTLERFSAELGAMLLLPREGTLDDDESRGGEIGYMGGYGAGCFEPFRSRRFGICGAFEIGRLSGTGVGVTNQDTGNALWLAPALFGTARLPALGPLHGEARLGAALALHRPEFGLDDLGEVHKPALFSLRGELGFSFH